MGKTWHQPSDHRIGAGMSNYPSWKMQNGQLYSVYYSLPKNLSYRRLVTLNKTQFDFKCDNCRIKIEKNNTANEPVENDDGR